MAPGNTPYPILRDICANNYMRHYSSAAGSAANAIPQLPLKIQAERASQAATTAPPGYSGRAGALGVWEPMVAWSTSTGSPHAHAVVTTTPPMKRPLCKEADKPKHEP
jgi:hypothetical protein